MPLKRLDNVLIVVDDLDAVKAFFIELGLTLEGQTTVEGPAVGALIGLTDVRATLAMLRTPDGQGIELDKFHTPEAVRFGPVNTPVNALGIRRVMFAVDGLDALVTRLRAGGAEFIGEMQYGGRIPPGVRPRAGGDHRGAGGATRAKRARRIMVPSARETLMTEHPIITFVRGKVTDPSRPFTLIADLEAQPGRGDDVAAAIAASGAVGLTRAEPGCVAYDVSRDADAPDRFVAYETWRDLPALEAHLATSHFAAVGAALQGLLAGAPAVRVLTPVVGVRE